jgi:hypothetical protein
MQRGLHEVGDEVSWSLRPDETYALPPGGAEEAPAPLDPEAAAPDG